MGDNSTKQLMDKPKNQTSIGINIIIFILSITAGWINAVGIELFLNEDSSFMTGRAKALGYHIFNLDFKLFLGVVSVIVAFIVGSFFSTIVTKRMGLKGGLILTGMLIIIPSLIQYPKYTIKICLPMAMGCQNAATSLTPINRTTHLTGPMTDLGINLAKGNWHKAIFWFRRLIGFSLGSLIGFNLVNMVSNKAINISITLIIPASIIILTGIIQERILDIPLIE